MNCTEQFVYTTAVRDDDADKSSDYDARLTKEGDDDYAVGWSSDQQSLEDQLVIRIIYGIIAVLGIVGNFLVMFTVARVSVLWTLTNAFIVALAACDFITSVFLIPLHLGITIYIPPGAAGAVMCSMLLSKWPLWTSFTASVLSLTCVTLERYFSICRPLHYNTIFTEKKVATLVVVVWIAAIIMNSYMFYVVQFNGVGCIIRWVSVAFQKFVGISNFCVIYAIPLTTMCICYVTIMRNLSESAGRLGQSSGKESEAALQLLKARKKVIKMLAIVVITFAICWAPNQFMFLSYNLGVNLDFTSWHYHSSVLIAFCNSCMNPFIYGFRSRSYRKSLKIAVCGETSVNLVAGMDTVMAVEA